MLHPYKLCCMLLRKQALGYLIYALAYIAYKSKFS